MTAACDDSVWKCQTKLCNLAQGYIFESSEHSYSEVLLHHFSSTMLHLFLIIWGVRSVMERAGYEEKVNSSWISLGSGLQNSHSEQSEVAFPESLWRFTEKLNQEVLRICIPAAHSGRVCGSDVLQTGRSNTSSTDRTQSCWRDNTDLCTVSDSNSTSSSTAYDLGDRAQDDGIK